MTALVLFLGGAQVLTAVYWARAVTQRGVSAQTVAPEDVTVIMPIAGLPKEESVVAINAARFLGPDARLFYVVGSEDDESARVLKQGLSHHALDTDPRIRVLTASGEGSRNPKLDSIAPAYAAATSDHIICIDGNVSLPPDYVRLICREWTPEITALSAAPQTTGESNLAAYFEGAVINLSHARWLKPLARIGVAFAHGKLLAFRKSWLDRQGGLAALHCKRAEDTALTTLVRRSAGRLRLVEMPVLIKLGQRRWADILARNFRWRFLRSRDVTLGYLVEPFSTVWPVVVLAAAISAEAPILVAAATWAVLHLIEVAAWSRVAGRWTPLMHAGLMMRDVAEPAMWLLGWWLWRHRNWRATASSSRAMPSEGSE